MDIETLRRQLVEEIQEEFESKLREAKRQKTNAEEELESASERWRSERRKLNSEIDRLERALSETTESLRKKLSAGAADADPEEIERIQKAGEEKLRNAAAEWDQEKTRLNAKIARLERTVAETIERSANPMRAALSVKEQFEAKLADAAKQRRELEQQLLRMKAEWDEDRKKSTGEIIRLRRFAPSGKTLEAKLKGVSETFEEARIRELEERLTAANAEVQKYHSAAATAREEARALYEKQLEAEHAQRIKAEEQLLKDLQSWESERQRLQNQLAQLQQAAPQPAPDSTHELERARQEWNAERLRLASQIQKLEQDLAEASAAAPQPARADAPDLISQLEEASRERAGALERLQNTTAQWSKEREDLLDEISRLKSGLAERQESVSPEVVDQLRQQYAQKLQEMTEQKTQLTRDLESVNEILEAERSKFAESLRKPRAAAAAAATGQLDASNSFDPEAIEAEVAQVEGMIQEITNLIDDPSTELSTIVRKNVEKAELTAYLKGIKFSVGRGKALA